MSRPPRDGANASEPDKTGRWITFPTNFTPTGFSGRVLAVWDSQTNTWQYLNHTPSDDDPHHGDVGSGFMVGRGDWSGSRVAPASLPSSRPEVPSASRRWWSSRWWPD